MHLGHIVRPPEQVPQVQSLPVLERLGSPLEDGRDAKKHRSHGDLIPKDMLNESMETNEVAITGENGSSDARPSYAQMAATLPQHDYVRLNLNKENEIEVPDEDCFVDESGPFPTIKIGYKALLNRIQAIWKPVGEIQVIDLENNYYLVKFSTVSDYEQALTGGPWTIYGSYLTVQPWSRSFSTTEKHPSQVVVWVRLPSLPFRYYSKALFRRIAAIIGVVIKVDYCTKAGERGKFARLAILVDLNKPLRSCIGIDGFVQRLEYEGLNQICFSCGVYSHSMEGCPGMDKRNGESQENNASAHDHVHFPSFSSKGAELFGPWMVVENRRRRARPSNVTGKHGEADVRGNYSSMFEVLEVEESLEIADENVDPRGKAPLLHVPQESIRRNAAYLASNPDKKKQMKGKGMEKTSDSIVLPSVPSSKVTVVDREVNSSKSVHQAILIAEEGVRNMKAVGVKLHNFKGGLVRTLRDKEHRGAIVSKQYMVPTDGVNWVPEEPPDHEGDSFDEDDHMGGSDVDGVDGAFERYAVRGKFPTLASVCLESLGLKISNEEIRRAFFDMAPLKAPGIDGIHAAFYQRNWQIVGDSVCRFIRAVFEDNHWHSDLNRTLLVLLPKVSTPEHIIQFCPISLCNVIYKTITKVIVNRLKPYMPDWVTENQTSFVPRRSIVDNVIIAQEIMHSMSKKTGRKGWMAVKVDLEKAYDRLEWSFIEDTFLDLGLPIGLVRLIMRWDPLSPYLFVLCMERLAQAIVVEVDRGKWKPFRVFKDSPTISHLFFADDMLLFAEASLEQAEVTKSVIEQFGTVSDQKRVSDLEKYLGVPLPTTVDSMVTDTGQWNVFRLSGCLPEPVIQRILTIRPPHACLGRDIPAWRWTDNQLFMAKVAYEKLACNEEWECSNEWRMIWRKSVELETDCMEIEPVLLGVSGQCNCGGYSGDAFSRLVGGHMTDISGW
ncbi:hypothetical protein GQ457_10G003160 [Hibiscus cannabinus]